MPGMRRVRAIAEAGRLAHDDPAYRELVAPLIDVAAAAFDRHRALVSLVLPDVERQAQAATTYNPTYIKTGGVR